MFVNLEDAIEIVLELARQNVLEPDGDANLEAECERQLEAIRTVEDFFANNVCYGCEDDE